MVKNLPAIVRLGFNPWVGKIPWRRAWQPTSVFLPGGIPWTEEPGGLYSPWGRKESHATEATCMQAPHSHDGIELQITE